MSKTGHATFTAKTWEESTYSEIDAGRKLTRVQATFVYEGDIEGEGSVNYLMAYDPDGSGSFVGIEKIAGRVGDRSGSFVVQHTGTFDPQSVSTRWDFVPGLGSNGLEGLVGGGELKLIGHGPYPFDFNYAFK